MTTSLQEPDDPAAPPAESSPSATLPPPETALSRQIRFFVAICAFASGVLYLAEMAARYDAHPTLGRTYLMLAVLEVTWGALLLVQPSRLVYALGALLTGVLVVAWAITRTRGISWFPGLHEVQPLGWRDVVTQFFQLFAIAGAVVLLLPASAHEPAPADVELTPVAILAVIALLTVGVVYAGTHDDITNPTSGTRTTTTPTTTAVTTTTIAPTTTTTAPGGS